MPDKYVVVTAQTALLTSVFADGNILTLRHGTARSIAFRLP